jgi:trehalose synthase
MTMVMTSGLTECQAFPLEPERLQRFVPHAGAWESLVATTARVRALLEGHAVLAISARSRSGGLAEHLQSLVAYARGAGVDARWSAISAGDEFFRFVRILQDSLNGEGDDCRYGDAERNLYEQELAPACEALSELLVPGDVVQLHDAPTAGLIPAVKDVGCYAIWNCRRGVDVLNEPARRVREFLAPYTSRADACVFSRPQFVWDSGRGRRTYVIRPSVSPLSPKNQELDSKSVSAILAAAGVQPGPCGDDAVFSRVDGSPGRVDRAVHLVEGPRLEPETDLVLQVSQWNRLNDPATVIDLFADQLASRAGVHLMLAGPDLGALADDPRAPAILARASDRQRCLPAGLRARVHLVILPIEDPEESAAIINALERRAAIVLQQTRGGGFGMSVLESMWKRRPVVCSRVGSLLDYVVDGETGFLCDPLDPNGLADAAMGLLANGGLCERMGAAARDRVERHFLLTRELTDWATLFESLPGRPAARGGRAHG